MLDEEMDGVAREQRQRLETIEQEVDGGQRKSDVRRRLGRVWQVIESTDIEMADASDRIKEHRERQQRLEIAADEARASRPILTERRVMLDSADTIAAYATEMSGFLKTSEITEARSCGRSSRRSWSGLAGPRSTTRFPRRRTAPSVEPTPLTSPYLAELMSTVRVGGR